MQTPAVNTEHVSGPIPNIFSERLPRLRPLCLVLRVLIPERAYLFHVPCLLQRHLPHRQMLVHNVKPDGHALRTYLGMSSEVSEHVAFLDGVLAVLRLWLQRVWVAFAAVASVGVEPALRDMHSSVAEVVL
jgi:hypothetical protein